MTILRGQKIFMLKHNTDSARNEKYRIQEFKVIGPN